MKNKQWQLVVCFVLPFLATLTLLVATRDISPAKFQNPSNISDPTELVGLTLNIDLLVEAQTGNPVTSDGIIASDAAIILLIGGISCSGNQLDLLKRFSSLQEDLERNNFPVLAVYADPYLGRERAIQETRVLRRLSGAGYPFLISQDTLLNPRRLGIRTPQVVLAQSGEITRVIDLIGELQSTGPVDSDSALFNLSR